MCDDACHKRTRRRRGHRLLPCIDTIVPCIYRYAFHVRVERDFTNDIDTLYCRTGSLLSQFVESRWLPNGRQVLVPCLVESLASGKHWCLVESQQLTAVEKKNKGTTEISGEQGWSRAVDENSGAARSSMSEYNRCVLCWCHRVDKYVAITRACVGACDVNTTAARRVC
jgi:hypothetical protein